jgi:hypothetical protein
MATLPRNGRCCCNVHPKGPVTLEDVPSYLRERFVGKSGRYLLQIFARNNIWEQEPMQLCASSYRLLMPTSLALL